MLNLIPVILNILYCIILHIPFYTDRIILPGGMTQTYKQSPADRLYTADMPYLLYLQYLFILIGLITSLLILFGMKQNALKTVRLISTVLSAVLFTVILFLASMNHPKY